MMVIHRNNSSLILVQHGKTNKLKKVDIMKKLLSIITLSVALLFTGLVQAEMKVAIVDVLTVLDKMPESKKIIEQLNKEFEARQKALQAEEVKAKEAARKLEKDRITLSASERNKLENVFVEFRKNLGEFNYNYEQRKKEEFAKLFVQIEKAVRSVAEDGKYDLILNTETVLYVNDKVDVTDKVLAKVVK